MEWKPIKGFEGVYEVSSDGQIRKFDGSVMNQWPNHNGYMLVKLTSAKLGKRAECKVHRLVAEAFIPNPENKPFINHIDNDPANNQAANLEWCTQKENIAHARRQNRMKDDYWKGKKSPNASLSDEQVREVRRLHAAGISQQAIADLVKTNKRTVQRILKGESYGRVV